MELYRAAKILLVKEEGDASQVNQSYDQVALPCVLPVWYRLFWFSLPPMFCSPLNVGLLVFFRICVSTCPPCFALHSVASCEGRQIQYAWMSGSLEESQNSEYGRSGWLGPSSCWSSRDSKVHKRILDEFVHQSESSPTSSNFFSGLVQENQSFPSGWTGVAK